LKEVVAPQKNSDAFKYFAKKHNHDSAKKPNEDE